MNGPGTGGGTGVPGEDRAPLPPLPLLLDAVLGIGSGLELRTTLQRIVDSAAELTGARHGTLQVHDPGDDNLPAVFSTDVPQGGGTASAAHGDEDEDEGQATDPHTLQAPVHVDDRIFGTLRLDGKRRTHPAGSAAFSAVDAQLLRVLATQAGIAIGNARLYEATRLRERWIRGTAAVTTALLTGDAVADALMTVAEQARILADAAAGVVLLPTPEGGMEIAMVSTLDPPGRFVGETILPGSAVLEQLLGGEPVFIDDSATDARMTTQVRSRFGPSMMLPLQADGHLIGTLALPRHRGGRPYTALERLRATQFASQAALALVLADAQQSRQQLAVFEDRDRIARDLHDLVVQRLFATGMMLQATQRKTPDGQVQSVLSRAVDELESTIQEVRTAIFALQQPPAEAPTTLRGKVLRETAAVSADLGFPPSVHFAGAVDTLVDGSLAGQLLTVLRRFLTTAAGRRDVSRIEVTVDAEAHLPDGRPGLRLTVRADGTDPDPGADRGPDPGATAVWQAPL